MGQETSVAGGAAAPRARAPDSADAVEPLLRRIAGGGAEYLEIANVQSGQLPAAARAGAEYYGALADALFRNEEAAASAVQRQLEDYVRMAQLLERRRGELDGRLASMLSTFRAFDSEVRATVELLNAEIKRADEIAAQISDELPRFADFRCDVTSKPAE